VRIVALLLEKKGISIHPDKALAQAEQMLGLTQKDMEEDNGIEVDGVSSAGSSPHCNILLAAGYGWSRTSARTEVPMGTSPGVHGQRV
jgi:hypothetical protein